MKTKKLVVSAMLIAIATVLSFIQPFSLPFGGGITLASMMPVIIIAYMYGIKWGCLSAFVYSLIQIVLGIKTVSAFFLPGEGQMSFISALLICLIDYILAYTVLGFGGIFKNKFKNDLAAITVGSIFATFSRYILHIISGAVFFGSWAEWFFTQEGFYAVGAHIMNTFSGSSLALVYSVFYNGLYMIPEIIITSALTPLVYRSLNFRRNFS